MADHRKQDTKPEPAKSAGPTKYRLTEKFYRDGVMYQPGDIVACAPGQEPGKTWELLEDVKAKAAKAAEDAIPVITPPTTRVSDQEI